MAYFSSKLNNFLDKFTPKSIFRLKKSSSKIRYSNHHISYDDISKGTRVRKKHSTSVNLNSVLALLASVLYCVMIFFNVYLVPLPLIYFAGVLCLSVIGFFMIALMNRRRFKDNIYIAFSFVIILIAYLLENVRSNTGKIILFFFYCAGYIAVLMFTLKLLIKDRKKYPNRKIFILIKTLCITASVLFFISFIILFVVLSYDRTGEFLSVPDNIFMFFNGTLLPLLNYSPVEVLSHITIILSILLKRSNVYLSM